MSQANSVPELSDALLREIRTALRVKEIPPKFSTAIAKALDQYKENRTAMTRFLSTEREIDRLIKSSLLFKKELGAALPGLSKELQGLTVNKDLHEFVLEELNLLRSSLEVMFAVLEEFHGWDCRELLNTDTSTSGRGRGNPHQGRDYLRQDTFEALEDLANVPVRKTVTGPAAQVLRVVLEEADRIDGNRPRSRAEFSGSQWSRWVDDYHANRHPDVAFGPGPSQFMLAKGK